MVLDIGQKKWVCNDGPIGGLLAAAQGTFRSGWEFSTLGGYFFFGFIDPLTGLHMTNCEGLVTYTLNQLGYHSAPRNPYFYDWNEYFCEVPLKDAGKGDIVETPEHLEFLEEKRGWTYGGEQYWTLTGWGAFDYPRDKGGTGPNPNGIGSGVFQVDPEGKFAGDKVRIWRPKRKVGVETKCLEVEFWGIRIERRLDPLVLDLDGNGIQTVGTSSGMHFDGDHNGFKEATGWAAPGDGMLMLDMNGNGRLDDGRRLTANSVN